MSDTPVTPPVPNPATLTPPWEEWEKWLEETKNDPLPTWAELIQALEENKRGILPTRKSAS